MRFRMRLMRMFEGIKKSKFYTKCKWDLNQIRSRIEFIKKKRNAIQKFLRKDIADLIKSDLDVNAYGRAEGLIVEMNRSDCYVYVDQCCEHILNHLETMDKERECPEECKEAAASLVFAAARFADLPELRQLRTLFSEKYGSSLDYYVSKQFSEKATSGLPSREAKLQLLQDLAEEYGLEWNSEALENKLLYNTSAKPKESKNMDISNQRQEGESRRKTPRAKDIPVDNFTPREEPISVKDVNKPPLKYNMIPPPYTKSEDKGGTRTSKNPPSPINEKDNETINKEKAAEGQRILRFLDKDEDSDDRRDNKEKLMNRFRRYFSRKGSKEKSPPGRASSLPEQTSPPEDKKGRNRATSLPSNRANVHVHPRLPDYDDLVTRLAALKENGKR